MGNNAFPTQELNPLCSKIGSGATPRGGSKVYLDRGEIALIRSQNVRNEHFEQSGIVFIEQKHADQLANVIVEKGDVLLNITGDSVARCCQVDSNFLPARVNQHVAIIRPKPERLDDRFLRYFLISPFMQNLMLSWAGSGGTRDALTKGMIESFKVPLPPLSEQKAIAHVLGSLDDRIELNRRMNETLESMAQALFKSWFVDFDPVIDNALAGGKEIPAELSEKAQVRAALGDKRRPLPEEIRALFPDEFTFSDELGWIPKGWEVVQIKKFGKVTTGKTPPKKIEQAFSDTEVPFITPSDIDNSIFVVSTDRYLSSDGEAAIRNSFIQSGTICVTCIGSQMGKTVITTKDSYTNQQINSVSVEDVQSRNYLFFNLRNRREEIFTIGSSGSTMPIINKSTFERLLVLLPGEEVLKIFNELTTSFLDSVLSNELYSLSLSGSRNILLPKLLSGEVRIPDAEKMVEELSL
ncbi:MAG: restriction endonuclease subunit S [Deltaproteobacteria bacterium]|nr:restriction endonuclease subunit S [Deltaproteobacteria bacterium]